MALYEVTSDNIIKIQPTSFDQAVLYEGGYLQHLLKRQIDVILTDVLIIAEEFRK